MKRTTDITGKEKAAKPAKAAAEKTAKVTTKKEVKPAAKKLNADEAEQVKGYKPADKKAKEVIANHKAKPVAKQAKTNEVEQAKANKPADKKDTEETVKPVAKAGGKETKPVRVSKDEIMVKEEIVEKEDEKPAGDTEEKKDKDQTIDIPELAPGECIVEINNLCKGFANQDVLKNVSFKLYKGENLVVLGKSGTGKSVLIQCIVGLLMPDNGTVDVLGHRVNDLKTKELDELRTKIGFLFQSGALYDSMTVRENLEFPLRRIKKDMKDSEVEAKIKEVLENVGLADAIDKIPSQLSGGMRKRISLARTIIVDPLIMLYDEPTTGLDPVTSDEISCLINEVQKKYHTSSIIITHDIECARATSNRVIMLKDGEVYMDDKIEVFEKSDDKMVRAFFK